MKPQPGEVYRHFKGRSYRIVTLAFDADTGEEMVVYRALYGDGKVYVRPLDEFLSPVDRKKYPDVTQRARFEKTEDAVAPEPVQESVPQTGAEQVPQAVSSDDQTTGQDEPYLDPRVVAFLDAKSVEDKLTVLEGLHSTITEDMIDIMSLSLDLKVRDGDLDERFNDLKDALRMRLRFESSRLR